MADGPKYFDESSRKRIARAVLDVEAMHPRPRTESGPLIHHETQLILTKNTGTTWSKGTTRDLNAYYGTQGSETSDSDHVFLGVYNRMADIGASKWVYIGRINGQMEAWQAEC